MRMLETPFKLRFCFRSCLIAAGWEAELWMWGWPAAALAAQRVDHQRSNGPGVL